MGEDLWDILEKGAVRVDLEKMGDGGIGPTKWKAIINAADSRRAVTLLMMMMMKNIIIHQQVKKRWYPAEYMS